MPKVSIVAPERARPAAHVPGIVGEFAAAAYFDSAAAPLRLHRLEIAPGRAVRLDARDADRVGYVWTGSLIIGGHALPAGSSFIVERDAITKLAAGEEGGVVLVFEGQSVTTKGGGNVHLLPSPQVPRSADLGGASGVSGGIHADSDCPTTSVWLHENRMPGTPDGARRDGEAGIHSHSEDEIIFVIEGQIRFGARLYEAGTAVQIAADTLYSFTPGPAGVGFINFRAGRPGDIKFANGHSMSETEYWRSRLPRPAYIEV